MRYIAYTGSLAKHLRQLKQWCLVNRLVLTQRREEGDFRQDSPGNTSLKSCSGQDEGTKTLDQRHGSVVECY